MSRLDEIRAIKEKLGKEKGADNNLAEVVENNSQVDSGEESLPEITAKYSIRVTNELFHHVNLEAWKKIISAYNEKYPHLKVNIFFNSKKIEHINELFQWGSVKHGDGIFISVEGKGIQGVSKLKEHLYKGASKTADYFLNPNLTNLF